jgi:hypothetical protein
VLPQAVDVLLGQDAHAADVRWRISTSGSPHLFVLGIPGQGKSVTTRRILNSFAEQGLPALVVDFHGDMAAAPAGGAAVLDASQGLPISPFELDNPRRYREAAWELSEVIGYVCGLGEIQRNVVYEGVRAAYEKHGYGRLAGPTSQPTMDELAAAVSEAEGTGRGRNVVARLRPLSDFGLFVDQEQGQGFADLLRQGVVLDVHGLMEQVQLAAGAFVLRKVYREMFRWGQTGQLRLAVVLDEAHRLARDVTLPKIMKEGRKYGVAVVVASQGVDDFHKDVLSNAGTKVAFRCNYPQSRTVAGFLRGRDGQDMSAALEQLAVGQAYVSTPEQATARKVFMLPDDDEKAVKSERLELEGLESSNYGDYAIGATPSIRADGSVLYDGRIGVPNPSPGKLIATKTGKSLHYSAECPDLKNRDSAGWLTYPDPGRDLWHDILVVAPIMDEKKRTQFALSRGLVNGEGRPILWVCERCVLRIPPSRIRERRPPS